MSTGKANDELSDGHEPTEEVGAEECGPKAQDCEFKSGSMDDESDASRPKFADEIAEAYVPDPGLLVLDPTDGLPIPADEKNEAQIAPPFTIDHVVCVEDMRKYVELFIEDFDDLPGSEFLVRSMYDDHGNENKRLQFEPHQISKAWGADCVAEPDKNGNLRRVPVRPIRERCKHYARQVLSNDSEPDPNEPGHQIIFRNCMIRRSVGGAFMSLRDEAVYACDYRDPPDPGSVKKHLDDKDEQRLKSEAHRVMLPLFRKG